MVSQRMALYYQLGDGCCQKLCYAVRCDIFKICIALDKTMFWSANFVS